MPSCILESAKNHAIRLKYFGSVTKCVKIHDIDDIDVGVLRENSTTVYPKNSSNEIQQIRRQVSYTIDKSIRETLRFSITETV